MRIIFIVIYCFVFTSFINATNNFLIVEKWIITPNSSSKKIIARYNFNERKDLVSIIHFNSNNNLVTDSIAFVYDNQSVLVEQIECLFDYKTNTYSEVNRIRYFYNKTGKLIDIKGLYNIPQLYSPQYNSQLFKDSLKLLQHEISEIEKIKSNVSYPVNTNLLNSVTEVVYKANFRPAIMEYYGVPNNEVLSKMIICYSSDSFLKSTEFNFENLQINQKYLYVNSLISEIKTEIKYNDGDRQFYTLGFNYK